MAINKVPNNYYNDTNIRRDKINTIIDHVNELDTHPVVPTPAAGDVGKVVKVGSDGYELASDAGAKLVVATVTADGQGNLSCDKTYAELSASIANGDLVELSYNNQTFVFSGIDFPGIHFVLAKNDSNGHNVITAWTISSANVITFLIEEMNSELPSYSSADSGKVLSVDNNGILEFITGNEIKIYEGNHKIANPRTISINDFSSIQAFKTAVNNDISGNYYPIIKDNQGYMWYPTTIDPNVISFFALDYSGTGVIWYDFGVNPGTSGTSATINRRTITFD